MSGKTDNRTPAPATDSEDKDEHMTPDTILDTMKAFSVDDLTKIQTDLQRLIVTKKEEAQRAFLARMKEQAEAEGIDLDAVLGNIKGNQGKGIPKYQHPTNPRKTWTGKGRKPAWLEALIKDGKTLDDFKI